MIRAIIPRSLRRLAWPLGLAGLLAGCGSSPPVHYYTLDAVPPAAPALGNAGPAVQVGSVNLPALLDRVQMIRPGDNHQVAIDDLDRWAASLDDLTRRAFTRDLALRLPARPVMTTDDMPPKGPVQVVGLSIGEFDGDTAGRVVLQLRWTIFAGTPLAPTAQGVEDIRVQAASGAPAAIAGGMSQALGLLADRLAAALPPR